MQYLLLMAAVPDAPPEPVDLNPPTSWLEEMRMRGADLGGARLRPPAEATSVRITTDPIRLAGETVVVDGPFAELREQVAGFGLIAAEDLDEAIEIAAKHPSARLGAIEIRPIVPDALTLWESATR